jgi:hypothetical protein
MKITRLDVFMARIALEKARDGADKVKSEAAKRILSSNELFYDFVKATVERQERKKADVKMSA